MYFSTRWSIAGGIPRFTRDLASHLDRDQFEVHACTIRPLFDHDQLDEVRKIVTMHTLGVVAPTARHELPLTQARLRRVLSEVRPDVLHLQEGSAFHAVSSGVTGRFPKATILQIHDPPEAAKLGRAQWFVQRQMCRRFGLDMVVDSPAVAPSIAGAMGIATDDVTVLPLGIGSADDVPRDREASRGTRARPVVVYIARLAATKNVGLFIDVASDILDSGVDADFLVAGEGGQEAELAARIPEVHRERIRLLGFIDDVRTLLRGADVFLSTSDSEGFGLAVVEAMLAGTAIVATAVDNVPHLIEHDVSGLLAPAGDRVALADGVRTVLRDPALQRRLGEAASARAVEHFTVAAMAKRYGDHYRHLVASRST